MGAVKAKRTLARLSVDDSAAIVADDWGSCWTDQYMSDCKRLWRANRRTFAGARRDIARLLARARIVRIVDVGMQSVREGISLLCEDDEIATHVQPIISHLQENSDAFCAGIDLLVLFLL